jgi:hypothetical protein
MAEPQDQRPAAAGRSHLRASHADREQVIGTLKTAFVQGMLAKDEFDLSVSQAFASRTYADLAALTADLPPGLAVTQPPEHAGESPNKKKRAVIVLSCATPAVAATPFALPPLPDGSPFAVPVIVFMFVLFGAVSTGWLLLLNAWLDERAGRQSAQGLPPGGGGQASQRPATVSPGGELPPVNPGQQKTAEAAPIRRPRRLFYRWRPLVSLPSAR